jgi:hypothetical protein
MVKYASWKHLLFVWKVSIKYTLIYWIHEYYLSQWSWILRSSLTPLHNIEETHVLVCIFFEMQVLENTCHSFAK